ncbi:MAG: hypothetical protein JRI55_12230 [Deltaproteobacteria bacterium]|jgi:hypothetical protein|nr:hypothetical protein [Deltaproteobacteria bacterium]
MEESTKKAASALDRIIERHTATPMHHRDDDLENYALRPARSRRSRWQRARSRRARAVR